MRWVLVKKRMVWCPTVTGWFCLFLLTSIPALWWIFYSEAFLALHHPEKNATILVVEGWIGLEGLKAARIEYQRGKYDWIVATGCINSGEWTETQSNCATMAGWELQSLGVPKDQLIVASAGEPDRHRTYQSALTVKNELHNRGLYPQQINVFTKSIHSRRSRLVFNKVFSRKTKVGCLSWCPEKEKRHFWHSSSQSENLIQETVAYFFELFLSSGRKWFR